MSKTLNTGAIAEAMQRIGLNQAQLAGKIDVSRAAVSNWFAHSDFPRPDKLMKLGMALALSYKELVIEEPAPFQPVVAFRRKAARKTTPEHVQRAIHMGTLLRDLAPYLPFEKLTLPPTLSKPVNEYGYLQRVSAGIRSRMGVSLDAPIHYRDLIAWFDKFNAVLVPVLWGDKQNHENALHIFLPDSGTTWVYLNLDSYVGDFNFWMAHELGHVHAPNLLEDAGEDFADAFAQALLFPECCAAAAYTRLIRLKSEGARVKLIKSLAETYRISPTTINLSVQAYAEYHNKTPVHIGASIHGAPANFNKALGKVSDQIFLKGAPSAKAYIAKSRAVFHTPFFDALQRHLRDSKAGQGYVETVLQIPLLDAKSVFDELR
jgi:transcriptional regulator with XRE-family HTH domain